jgi:hypothetical protein
MKVSKQGSTLAGIMDAFSISVSLGLQHGVPLATYVRKYTNMKFEPAGITDDAELRIATSLVDYIFRRLAVDYLPLEERAELGVLSTAERMQPTLPGVEETATRVEQRGRHRGRRSGDRYGDRRQYRRWWTDDRSPGHRGGRRPWNRRALGAPLSGPPDRRAGDIGATAGPGRAPRRPVLLSVRERHAAGRVVLRVRQLRHHQRVLVR